VAPAAAPAAAAAERLLGQVRNAAHTQQVAWGVVRKAASGLESQRTRENEVENVDGDEEKERAHALNGGSGCGAQPKPARVTARVLTHA